MLDSLRLAVALAELGVARAGGKTARRLAWTTVLTVIAAVAAVASAAFAIASLWFALAPMIGRPEAALILAGILFAFCLIGLLGSRFLVSRKPERALAAGDIDAALASACARAGVGSEAWGRSIWAVIVAAPSNPWPWLLQKTWSAEASRSPGCGSGSVRL